MSARCASSRGARLPELMAQHARRGQLGREPALCAGLALGRVSRQTGRPIR